MSKITTRENFHGYEISSQLSMIEVVRNIDKRVFEVVVERLAEDLYNKHKEQILETMSVKSLIKAVYKKLEKDMYVKMKGLLNEST